MKPISALCIYTPKVDPDTLIVRKKPMSLEESITEGWLQFSNYGGNLLVIGDKGTRYNCKLSELAQDVIMRGECKVVNDPELMLKFICGSVKEKTIAEKAQKSAIRAPKPGAQNVQKVESKELGEAKRLLDKTLSRLHDFVDIIDESVLLSILFSTKADRKLRRLLSRDADAKLKKKLKTVFSEGAVHCKENPRPATNKIARFDEFTVEENSLPISVANIGKVTNGVVGTKIRD